jgi:rhamnose transport system permease protein
LIAHLRREIALACMLALLMGVVALAAPGFFAAGNLRNLFVDGLPLLVAATGMTLLMLAGEIDISIGAQFAVCGVVLGLASKAGLPPIAAIATTLAAGAALGAINGFFVARLRVPAVITTLASMAVLRGALRWWSGGQWIQDLPGSFRWFGATQEHGQMLFVAASVALFALAAAGLRWTSAGRTLPAVGCDAQAARLAGIRPERVVFGAFVVMGALTAAAALLNFPRYPAIEIEAGLGFELEVIACVVVGGTAIQGGRGTLLGTLLGVLLLSAIGTVLVFLRVDPAWERAIQGAIILIAVAFDGVWSTSWMSPGSPGSPTSPGSPDATLERARSGVDA